MHCVESCAKDLCISMNNFQLVNIAIDKHFYGKCVYERSSAGIYSLVAALRESNINVRLYEHFINPSRALGDEIAEVITHVEDVPFVGIGAHAIHLPFVVVLTEAIKKRYPNMRIVLGGMGPSAVAKEILETFQWINYVVVGEGEVTLPRLIKADKEGFLREVSNIVYREGSNVYSTKRECNTSVLDDLPMPAYDLVDLGYYDVLTLTTSRGCYRGCSFCSLSSFWDNMIRAHSIDRVIEELYMVRNVYDVRKIFFADPTFNFERKRTIELCEAIIQAKLDLEWEALVHADMFDSDIMDVMKQAGCTSVFIGLETGSEAMFKRIKPSSSFQRSIQAIEVAARKFNTVGVGLMWGFPFESLDDFKQTIALREHLIDQLGCQVQLRWLEPYPATALYQEFKKTLFLPENESVVFGERKMLYDMCANSSFYCENVTKESVRIVTDITNVRFALAASHIAHEVSSMIRKHPYIFADYYRYKTPQIDAKIHIAQKVSIY